MIDQEALAGNLERARQGLQEIGPIFASDANIHNHTGLLGARCKEIFQPLDEIYSLSNLNKTLVQVKDEILADTPAAQRANVERALNTIQANNNKIEGETGLNVSELLIRTWALAEHWGAPDNSKGLIIHNLHHNAEAGGGCFAGISGRLVQPYTSMIKFILERLELINMNERRALAAPQVQVQEQNHGHSVAVTDEAEADMLAAAIERSLRNTPG